jgi:predicted CXXCH cytochrome family protein
MKFRRVVRRIILGPEDLTWGAKTFRATIFAFVVLILAVLGLAEYSTRPSFCNSCHIMEPYYISWSTSSHNNVPCVDCHYPPDLRGTVWVKYQALSQLAKYVTRTYGTKPYAEIEDASCLRAGCHDTRLLSGKVEYHEHVVFDHTPHLAEMRRQKKLRCTSCHSQMAIGDHMSATKETCFLCHFKNLEHEAGEDLSRCTLCHTQIPETVELDGFQFEHAAYAGRGIRCQKCHGTMAVGDGRVEKSKCLNCHAEPDRLEFYSQEIVLHRRHVTEHNLSCGHCHADILHERKATIRAFDASCSSCHSRMHSAPQLLYSGRGGIGVPDMPSHMFFMSVDCTGCHFSHVQPDKKASFAGQTYATTEAACIGCHDSDAKGLMADWVASVDEMLEFLEKKIQSTDRIYSRARSRNVPTKTWEEAARAYEAAHHNYSLVLYGHGVHNVEYAMALLERSEEDCSVVARLLQ